MSPFPSTGRRDPLRTPLVLSDERLQTIVDAAWSRQGRWSRFAEVARLLRTHDPDEGAVPTLLRAYLDQNILQPYFDGGRRDPRFWVMLGLSADHAEFIDFVRAYSLRYPSSLATTELLFLLDELIQGSRDALLMLLSTEPNRDLSGTWSTDRDAYELAVDIRDHYIGWLRARGLNSADAVKYRYDQLRLRLLSSIVDSTPVGYRVADARFLAGEIFFYQGNLSEALTWWQPIVPNASDAYFEAYTELLPEIRQGGTALTAKIIAILSGERGRWLAMSQQRLRQFGYAFDTF